MARATSHWAKELREGRPGLRLRHADEDDQRDVAHMEGGLQGEGGRRRSAGHLATNHPSRVPGERRTLAYGAAAVRNLVTFSVYPSVDGRARGDILGMPKRCVAQ